MTAPDLDYWELGFAKLTNTGGISVVLERRALESMARAGVDVGFMLHYFVETERARLQARGADLAPGSTLRFTEGERPGDRGLIDNR